MNKTRFILLVILGFTIILNGVTFLNAHDSGSTWVNEAFRKMFDARGRVKQIDWADGSGITTTIPALNISDIEVIFGSETALLANKQVGLRISYACTVEACYINAQESGTSTVDVWVSSVWPPTNADSITASAPIKMEDVPNNGTNTYYSDSVVADSWIVAIPAASHVIFNLDTNVTVKQFTVGLKIKK